MHNEMTHSGYMMDKKRISHHTFYKSHNINQGIENREELIQFWRRSFGLGFAKVWMLNFNQIRFPNSGIVLVFDFKSYKAMSSKPFTFPMHFIDFL